AKDRDTTSRSLAETREELEHVRAQYRELLARDLKDNDRVASTQLQTEAGELNTKQAQEPGVAISTLMQSYSTREARLLGKTVELERSLKASHERNARLFDR